MTLAASPIRVSAWLAIGFGPIELAIKVVRALHHPPWPAFAVYDYVPSLFLLSGGFFGLKYKSMERFLITGWAISFADYYHSFFVHLENLPGERRTGFASEYGMSAATGAFLAIAVVGLVAALWPAPRDGLQR
ncbi:hypothetical protein [Phenylobacterium sp.]|jgi:hypothetical protein|uniref:hypothetical protein n=1 Tax=Phenylobacterium sp. TaxID=1871053 RepID=UPI002F40047F